MALIAVASERLAVLILIQKAPPTSAQIARTFSAFDLPELEDLSLRSLAYRLRFAGLRQLLRRGDRHLQIVETAREIGPKVELLERLRDARRRGIVFKKVTGPYSAGHLPHAGNALKCKFGLAVHAFALE